MAGMGIVAERGRLDVLAGSVDGGEGKRRFFLVDNAKYPIGMGSTGPCQATFVLREDVIEGRGNKWGGCGYSKHSLKKASQLG
jgi:hypothetical protein